MSKLIDMTLGALRAFCSLEGQKVRPGILEFLEINKNLPDYTLVRIDEVYINLMEEEEPGDGDAGNRQA